MTIQKEDSEYWLGNMTEDDIITLVEALSYYKLALNASCGATGPEYAKSERKKIDNADSIRKILLTPFAKGEIKR